MEDYRACQAQQRTESYADAAVARDAARQRVADLTMERDDAVGQRDSAERRAGGLAVQVSFLQERERGSRQALKEVTGEKKRLQASVTQLQQQLSEKVHTSRHLERSFRSLVHDYDTTLDEECRLRRMLRSEIVAFDRLRGTAASVTEDRDSLADEVQGLRRQAEGHQRDMRVQASAARATLEREAGRHRSEVANLHQAYAQELDKRERDSAVVHAAITERDTALESVADITRQRAKAQRETDTAETRATDLAIQLQEREKELMSDRDENKRLQTIVTQLQHLLSKERQASTDLRETVVSITEERDTLADEVQGLRLQPLVFERAHLERERERRRSEITALHQAHAWEKEDREASETRRREFLSRRLRDTIGQRNQEREERQKLERVIKKRERMCQESKARIEILQRELARWDEPGRNMLEPLSETDKEAESVEVVEL
ncbi:hypothetical protein KIPB_013000 [Kipferlia bialata]|uniref:Uncharacterized protein n=1 Tax=Kipferlia bialata TaxID=797122 RepID=A0A391P0X5_9EUKA|nr:hypothetical protein KIPB_013000 [Kipferlia bialata]|eukprot:g13000.t1